MQYLSLALVAALFGLSACGSTTGSESRRVVIATYEAGGGGEGCRGSEHPAMVTLACGALYRFEDLHWNHWRAPVALAVGKTRGFHRAPGGLPVRGIGSEKVFPVRLFAYRIEACPNGSLRYTRLTWTFPKGTPTEPYKSSHEASFGCGYTGSP
jgi:hypothetical protein